MTTDPNFALGTARIIAHHPPSDVNCDDCASDILQVAYSASAVQSIVQLHADTCPARAGDDPAEVIAVLTDGVDAATDTKEKP